LNDSVEAVEEHSTGKAREEKFLRSWEST